MPNILALETSTDMCSVALLADDAVVNWRERIAPREHAKLLQPMVEDLLSSSKVMLRELNLVACGIGPGSFTGLRIAASAAQGLAFSLGIPLMAGCTLECQALNAIQGKLIEEDEAVLSVIDAKIGQTYWSLVTFQNHRPRTLLGPCVNEVNSFPWSQILSLTNDKMPYIAGDALILDGVSSDNPQLVGLKDVRPHAKGLLEMALRALEAGELNDSQDINLLYLSGDNRFSNIHSIDRS